MAFGKKDPNAPPPKSIDELLTELEAALAKPEAEIGAVKDDLVKIITEAETKVRALKPSLNKAIKAAISGNKNRAGDLLTVDEKKINVSKILSALAAAKKAVNAAYSNAEKAKKEATAIRATLASLQTILASLKQAA